MQVVYHVVMSSSCWCIFFRACEHLTVGFANSSSYSYSLKRNSQDRIFVDSDCFSMVALLLHFLVEVLVKECLRRNDHA